MLIGFPDFWTRSRGPMNSAPSIVSKCSRSVTQNSHTSHRRIPYIFGMKLFRGKWRKVTKPDFLNNIDFFKAIFMPAGIQRKFSPISLDI